MSAVNQVLVCFVTQVLSTLPRLFPFDRKQGNPPRLSSLSSPERMNATTTRTFNPGKEFMANPSNALKETEEALRNVIQILIDGQEGFKHVGDELKDQTHKRYFLAESLKRAQFRGDLENVLHQEGVHEVKESGSASGALHRTWFGLKHALGGGDHTLLESAEQGEDAAKEAYEDALNRDLPLPIRQILVSQSAHIYASHDYVKAARDNSN
jgi:uncharacterized protein (TIGR02284 family)